MFISLHLVLCLHTMQLSKRDRQEHSFWGFNIPALWNGHLIHADLWPLLRNGNSCRGDYFISIERPGGGMDSSGFTQVKLSYLYSSHTHTYADKPFQRLFAMKRSLPSQKMDKQPESIITWKIKGHINRCVTEDWLNSVRQVYCVRFIMYWTESERQRKRVRGSENCGRSHLVGLRADLLARL